MRKSVHSQTLLTSLLQQIQLRSPSGDNYSTSGCFTNICAFQLDFLFESSCEFPVPTTGKMKYLCVIVTAILAVMMSITSKTVMSQPVSCSFGSPDNRKLCAALASLYALPNSVEAYPNSVRPSFEYLPPEYKGRLNEFLENNLPGTKRQDVDHVFLRFGRRR